MSGIIAPVTGVITAPVRQNTQSRTQEGGPEAPPTAHAIAKVAVSVVKQPAQSSADTSSRLRDHLRAIAEEFGSNTSLVIRTDEKTKTYVYEFRDAASGKLIRQYPQADLAALLKDQRGGGSGIFLETQI
jgi:uncharacterized FlaG/YvyC family protein